MECVNLMASLEELNILVVDDDHDYHLMIEDTLDETNLSYSATFVTSVPEAMSLIETGGHFDIILVDYLLRPNTGFDLFTFIKNRNLRIPCIVLTNYDTPQLDQDAVSAGVADLIAKSDLKPGILKRSILYAVRDNQQRAQLEYLAHYDPLTGLVNRSLFFDRLDTACAYASRDPSYQFAVLYIDLDYFKSINDTYGHALGDQVLRLFAHKLGDHLRESDTAARLSGDEFAVLLHGASPPVAHMMAQKLLILMEKPLHVGGKSIQLTVSIGIATTQVSGIESRKLINDADCALYAAKRAGRSAYFHFNDNRSIELYEQVALEKDLKRALNEGAFELFYQPQFDMVSQALCGFETLVRWPHPERGLLSPADFLASIYRIGCDKQFTDLTLEILFNNMARMKGLLGDMKVALNLIPHQCLHSGFKQALLDYLSSADISPENIRIEITEHHLMSQLARLREPLSFLRAEGVDVALDDFGEKYSSLNVLAGLPVDVIKIDKLLVQKAPSDEKVACILEAITRITKGLDLLCIAEGIENEQQYRVAKALGCDQFQGFWRGVPRSFSETLSLLND
ncbi:MAG: EAL domain-containing protein [Ketobacteraceae bacterium]|nr:EAL domain-containing protein [Ketobacteraceae bacterium]